MLKHEWTDKLRHMLGVTEYKKKSSHGCRNHFAATVGSESYAEMVEMESAGFVEKGRMINNSTMQYFHATYAGCIAIELSKAAIKRAIGPQKRINK